jgi:hypothetical protein
MPWEIQYYSETVRQDIAAWPVGIRAMYARITERMQVFGPHLGIPLTRPLGDGLFEVRAKGKEGIGRALFCTTAGQTMMLWFNENGHLDKGGTIEHGGVPQWQRNDATMVMNSSERQSGW